MINLNLDSLPSFDVVSTLAKIPSLKEVDIDGQIPSNVNFKYYSKPN
jgi:hypothetical protein